MKITTKGEIIAKIVAWHGCGYVGKLRDNLVALYPNWDDIKCELCGGGGSEIKPRAGNSKPKFQAVYSSAALCVNSFAFVKEQVEQGKTVKMFGADDLFETAGFERKFSTGVPRSHPNIDFVLENKNEIICVESKFTEHLAPKLPNDKFSKYLNEHRSKLPRLFIPLVEHYHNLGETGVKLYPDVAQLIKHMLGIHNHITIENKGKKAKLVYLYWVPENHRDENVDLFGIHKKQIRDFATTLTEFGINTIEFEFCTYERYWNELRLNTDIPGINEHVDKLVKRYFSFDI